MDTPDRPEDQTEPRSYPTPAPLNPAYAPRPAAPWSEPAPPPADAEPPASGGFNPKVILRALRRHWWQILLLWAVGSAVLMTVAYYKIKPTYESTAWVEVKPTTRSLMAPSYVVSDFGPFLETQALLIKNPDVLGMALQDSQVAGLPEITRSLDPESDLRRDLNVEIKKGTHLIFVSMISEVPSHAAAIVNAVAKAYEKSASNWIDEDMQAQLERLEKLRKDFEGELAEHKEQLLNLSRKRDSVDMTAPDGSKETVTLDEYRQFRRRLSEVQTSRYQNEAMLAYLKSNLQRQAARPRAAPAGEDLEAAVKKRFLALPDVARIRDEIARLDDQVDRVERVIKNPQNDPTSTRFRKQRDKARDDYQKLWERAYPEIKAELSRLDPDDPQDQGVAHAEAEIDRLNTELVKSRIEEQQLENRIEQLRVETREANNEALEIRLEEEALNSSKAMLETIDKNIQQLEYEMTSGGTTINIKAKARESGVPVGGSKAKVMAAAPVGVLALVLGLFVLLEVRSARVADPEDLPARVRLDVLGVVPPLPSVRPARSLRAQRDERRRVEEFVQSLDHLRVALYAGRPDGSQRRCILITSAIGGEGKTTLAAQLAGRCANAGLLTLLVDADLRRPSLGDLLEVPEGPGLAEVLAGDVEPEAAMVVIGNAGGFHLLPAGQPGHDPSRLFHGERLEHLIAQFRSTFDVVIVDAPPVLAVPDALLLGRWTDGAVLAVRHDTSRFPLVERANRRLTSVGVPVLGAVVNGVRTMESNYGAYQYNPYASRGADGESA